MIISRGLGRNAVEKVAVSMTIIRISGDGQIAQFLVMMSKIATTLSKTKLIQKNLVHPAATVPIA